MNSLSGQEDSKLVDESGGGSGSLADQAYSKLVNMDTFSLVSKKDEVRQNPFEISAANSTVGGTQSLADIQSKKKDVSRDVYCTVAIGSFPNFSCFLVL